ncbi:MAG: SRPBCC domain-containing protein [Ignavibacteriales bacterium]|nr:SRPBCC domain-containing protein [Ignavibacteriales bacterium]
MINNNPIIVEQVYNAPIIEVWNALTNHNQMKQWYFDTIESFKAEVGFETKFNVRNGNIYYWHLWKVTEVEPEKRITYNWKYQDYPGDSFVSFELYPISKQTKLKLTHNGIESFPQDNPDFTRESCMNGWSFLIGNRLKEFLEK